MALLDLMGLGADKQAVIIDFGTAFTKVGLAGEQSPRHIIRTELKKIEKNQLVSISLLNQENKFSEEEMFTIFKEFFHEIYFKYLLVNPKERRVVICDSILKPIHVRNMMAKVLFTCFEVLSAVFVPSHLLALFACGLNTGLVVDSGLNETTVIPIFEQNTIFNGLEFIDLAAESVHREIYKEIKDNCHVKLKNEEQPASEHLSNITARVLEDIKVRCCFVGRRGDDRNAVAVKYPLGGDKILTVDGKIRAHAMDVQFKGDDEGHSIASIILDSLLKSPIDCRKALAEKIMLIGGNVMSPGFDSRLMSELKSLLKTDPRYKEKLFVKKIAFCVPPIPPNYCSWEGASILGALEILPELSITRDRYRADPTIPDWSSSLSVDKEDNTKGLLDDKYKWKGFRKNLSSTSLATGTSTPTSKTVTTATTTSQTAAPVISVSERLRQGLGLTK